MKRIINESDIVYKRDLLFTKPKRISPKMPVRKICENYVIDSFGTVFNTFKINGETVYETRFNFLI